MTRMPLTLPSYDAKVVWKFFDAVSSAVASRMVGGSSPGEENLTFLLCELLDENTTALHALPYSLSQAKRDLERSDSGITVDVDFQTHEHSKYVESKYSGADLGIVVEVDHPFYARSRRGILIQAKRLFATRRGNGFSLFSDYRSFNEEQAQFLKQLQSRFGVHNAIYYLWYNPPATALEEGEATIVRAYEALGYNLSRYWGRIHPMVDELIHLGFPGALRGGGPYSFSNKEEAREAQEWRAKQPALRLSELNIVLSLVEDGTIPQLNALYDTLLEDRYGSPSFSPFADFFLLALTSPRLGSADTNWLRLSEGRKVEMARPKKEGQDEGRSPLDELESPPSPRHTLKLTVRSTLPRRG